MRYFFSNEIDLDSKRVVISGDEYDHVVKVNRLHIGDECIIINGKGLRLFVRIVAIARKEVVCSILSHEVLAEHRGPRVTLCCALSRKGVFATVVEKAVELGVEVIVPLASERCVVKVDDSDAFIAKHEMTVREALKQCHRTVAPLIKEPVSVAQLKTIVKGTARKLLLEPSKGMVPMTVLEELRKSSSLTPAEIVLAIGPEGGFSDDEKREFAHMQFENVCFPDAILRTETAVIAMVSLIRYGA
jgi:16S rRNA (uracil1498-N3)-methyltransferase